MRAFLKILVIPGNMFGHFLPVDSGNVLDSGVDLHSTRQLGGRNWTHGAAARAHIAT